MTLANVLLLIGSVTEKQILFLPWLVLNTIGLFFTYVIGIVVIVFGFISLTRPENEQRASYPFGTEHLLVWP